MKKCSCKRRKEKMHACARGLIGIACLVFRFHFRVKKRTPKCCPNFCPNPKIFPRTKRQQISTAERLLPLTDENYLDGCSMFKNAKKKKRNRKVLENNWREGRLNVHSLGCSCAWAPFPLNIPLGRNLRAVAPCFRPLCFNLMVG